MTLTFLKVKFISCADSQDMVLLEYQVWNRQLMWLLKYLMKFIICRGLFLSVIVKQNDGMFLCPEDPSRT